MKNSYLTEFLRNALIYDRNFSFELTLIFPYDSDKIYFCHKIVKLQHLRFNFDLLST